MPTWLKVILMVLVALVAIVAGLGYIGFRWVQSHKGELQQQAAQVKKEATDFAEGKDWEQCITESLARIDRCDGLVCEVRTKVFLSFCLEKTGVPAEVCAATPKRTDFFESAKWAMRECARRGHANDQRCSRMLQTVQERCEKR